MITFGSHFVDSLSRQRDAPQLKVLGIAKEGQTEHPECCCIMCYPLVIKHGWLENGPLTGDKLLLKPPFSSGIFQPAVFDYQSVYRIITMENQWENSLFV